VGRVPRGLKKNIPSFTDEEVPVIKKLIQAAALLAACSGAAHASTYDFSYSFTSNFAPVDTQPPLVTGSFDGTLNGNLLTNISDVSVAVNGVAFNGPLSIGSWNPSVGEVNFAPNAAVVSTDGTLNNFVIVDTNDPTLTANFTNLFYYVNGTGPQGNSQEVSLQNIAGPSGFDADSAGGVGTWSLKPVPLPAALPLLVSGLGLFAAAKRRRREAAAA
jgi:hypothetical protein